jgi:hypothetical protein
VARRPHQRRLVAALAPVLLLLGAPTPTAAQADDPVSGRTTDEGVEITVERLTPGRQVTTADVTGADGTRRASCSLFPWFFEPGTTKGGIPPTADHRRFLVSCDREVLGTTWISPTDPLAEQAARAVDIAAIAERVLRDIPVGDVTIGRRPQQRALTGVPLYAWVEGHDGRPIIRTVRELGVTVDVRVALDRVTWDFGDGTPPVDAGLGEAWPQRSSVHHVYGASTPRAQPLQLAATLVLGAGYRVDGGPWLSLAPITRTASLPQDVDEVQAVRGR